MDNSTILLGVIIKKPSAMIQTNVKSLTLIQRKAINFIIHEIQRVGDRRTYCFSLSDLKRSCGISTTRNDDIKSQLRALTDIKIEFNYLVKDHEAWEINVLVASANIQPFTGIVEIGLAPLLQRRILAPNMFAPIDTVLVAGFRSSYSIVLYEFARDYLNGPGIPRLSIVELRALVGIKVDEYERFYNFKKKVLDVAVNEINEKSDLRVEYKLIKVGREYTHIQLAAKKKDGAHGKSKSTKDSSVFIAEARRCFTTVGGHGYCASTFERALAEKDTKPCFYCEKHARQRETKLIQMASTS